jgi:hypothetical protein
MKNEVIINETNLKEIEAKDIYKWLRSKNYQTDELGQGYNGFYENDMPKILNAFRKEFPITPPKPLPTDDCLIFIKSANCREHSDGQDVCNCYHQKPK